MCNAICNFLRNLWMPANIKKEIDNLHNNTIRWLWDEIYDKIYIIGETRTTEELIIRFPLNRIYEIDSFWKKYNYNVLDFYFYKLKVNTITHIPYKSLDITIDFYSDGDVGFLEISRKL